MKTEEHKVNSQNSVDDPVGKRDNSKVYFFIIAIAALLATNIYFYVKFKSSGEKLYTVTLQKENLQTEIDRIEAELDNLKAQDFESSEALINAEKTARIKIEELRTALEKGEVTDVQVERAKQDVARLKDQVSKMKDEVTGLKIKNELLAESNLQLKEESEINKTRANTLSTEKRQLTDKISKASNLKVSNIHIAGVEMKKSGDVELETKAKRIDKMHINFTIADNPLAETGKKDIYVRIINPKGNLIADSEDLFYVHGEKLQYTFKQAINFSNNGQEYQMAWSDQDHKFEKGAYTILLYADNSIMGRSSIVFK
ncbi:MULTISPECIES: hypothetical protein [Sphingobacterium]|uniref:Uncharacterized protein n=1 Tax=Sphingobacterium tenebrionis TaxID=3111775 RepID=A0ABU8I1G8_9SPHI|nr:MULTISPECIES: hypothetical protein [unclassified Sphingobacterium]QBR11106.1 hypothetical protein E3D81_02545 [Sphingobacterium sp. CZ-2]